MLIPNLHHKEKHGNTNKENMKEKLFKDRQTFHEKKKNLVTTKLQREKTI